MLVKKVGATLTATLTRAFATSATSGATNVGHIAIATGEEGAAAASADSSIVPLVLIGGKDGSGNNLSAVSIAAADGLANPSTLVASAPQLLFNGTTWDRRRSVTEVTHLASAARTTTQTGADTTNYNHTGLKVWVDVTSAGTGSITVSLQEKIIPTATYRTILASAAITANGTTTLIVDPRLIAAANAIAAEPLPRTWRILVTANNGNSMTYSVGYSLTY
jgi:hypothetical protein